MDYPEIGLGVDWINLVQDRDKWRVFVNTVVRQFHKFHEFHNYLWNYWFLNKDSVLWG
jgi:hypothetical protein